LREDGLSLQQRTALITGGTRGIGKGIAITLGQQGARVALAYRSNKAAAQNALRELQAHGAECFAVEADVTDASQVQFLLDKVVERFGRLDILVNNVGLFNWKPVAETSVEEWQQVLASNLLSVFYACRAALPVMRRQLWGRIVNLGAVGAERAFGQATISAYAAAKAAVVSFSRSLAVEEAKSGITVNVVNPSNIDERDLTLAEARRVRDARFPVGRPPTSQDVAAAVKFFASDEADYITGQVLNVSGGWML
jgi:3-oxoacyl-[acyl-carrier protein] reductase